DDIGRDDDHELGLVGKEIPAAEQGAEYGQVLDPRYAVEILLGALLDHAGHDHRTTGGQFDHGLGAADLQGGNRELPDPDAVLGRGLAYLAGDAHADAALAHHDRREAQADTERLELDRRRVVLLRHRDGNSPPARNLALSPEMAVRVGSARVRMRPSRS